MFTACRDYESVPGISYAKVERWFNTVRTEQMGVTDGKCILDFDLIAFPVNIGNFHWIDCLVDTRDCTIALLDSMESTKVFSACMQCSMISFDLLTADSALGCRGLILLSMTRYMLGCSKSLHMLGTRTAVTTICSL